MNKYLFNVLLFLVLLSSFRCVNAQMVYMPDSGLRLKLTSLGYGPCIVGDSIDSACPLLASTDILNLSSSSIYSIQGLEAFTSLEYLSCNYNFITSISDLPPNLIDLTLYDNQLTNLPTLPNSLIYFNCSFNQLTNLPSLPNSLNRLQCSNNLLISLPNLPATLTLLVCNDNQLTSLPALPYTLDFILCNYNQLTSIPSLPPTSGQLHCTHNLLTSLPNLPSSWHRLICNNNLLTYLPVLPSTLEILDCSNNQLTSLPALPNLMDFYCSFNQLTSLPDLPSSMGKLNCSNNQLSYLPDLPDTIDQLLCNDNPMLTCLPKINKINYFDFNNCPINCLPNYGNVDICNPPIISLPLCDLNNSNDCNFFWNISGKSYIDIDTNCIYSTNEFGMENIHLNLLKNGNLTQQVFTLANGNFSFDTDSFGNYQVQLDTANIPFILLCPTTNYYIDTINIPDTLIYDNDFAFKCKSGFDIGVWSIISSVLIPGRRSTVNVSAGDIANFYGIHCTDGLSGILTISINGSTHYFGPAAGSFIPSNVTGNVITYNIADFGNINFSSDFAFEVETDTSAITGSEICIYANITPTIGDNNINNNSFINCFTVRGSYDPNDKQVYPVGNIDTSQHWLTYTIRFQNTGTAPAQHIYVIDTLDNNIDLSFFQLLASSHPSYVQILERGIACFNFPNINLPDSFNNEPLSHGYIQYKVKLKDNLPIGTQIHNTAYIYFDFNVPVMTNTTSNTIDLSNGISKQLSDQQINVWPVPFENSFVIQTNKSISSHYSIVNLFGAEMVKGKMTSTQKINSESWIPGIYFLRIENENGVVVRKLIKE